ncbi:MAG TPA: flavohemoglobin expression-modulating QEGLA motif protein [Byssovorax sp.]|jgi:uncharacterized protein (TIGR02421 family)
MAQKAEARAAGAAEAKSDDDEAPPHPASPVPPAPKDRDGGKAKALPANDAAPGEKAGESDAPAAPVPAREQRPWRSYKEILASLAQRVCEAQRPIRILQALRWNADVEEQFFRARARELPKVTYDESLGFDPEAKIRELDEILKDASRELGEKDRLGAILRATADEYRDVVRMLVARGSHAFYTKSRRLYGSPKDKLPDGKTTVRDMGFELYEALTSIGGERLGPAQQRDISAETAAIELNARFDRFFGGASIQVQVDDSLLADAAAGSDYVKIRSGATFSRQDIDILEAHEGWVHVATSLNGQAQPVARWLAKGPPRTTAVQEGLAALVEIFTLRSTPRRAKKLNDRILAVDKAEDGASFLDVFEWYRTEGYEEEECFQNARRVFRGGLVEGGAPFTKDACYCKGIVLNYAFMRAAIQCDRAHLIPFLFVGKVAHEDVPVLHAHVTDGVVKPPPFLPPMFDDMNGLAIWLCYSGFFSKLGASAIAEHYAKLLGAA